LPSVFIRPSPPDRSVADEIVFSKIVTPYHATAFSFLSKHNLTRLYPFLVCNLKLGFPVGEFPELHKHVIHPIHISALPYLADINANLREEVETGRMSGPFTMEQATGPFQCSPIVVDVQPQPNAPDKIRICRHLSKGTRYHPSTNSYIDSEKFLTRFGSAAEVAAIVSQRTPSHIQILIPDQIAQAPAGTQAMTMGIAKFHRTCPLISDQKLWFVVQGTEGFYIDHTSPFGCSSASSSSGMISNAAVDIWECEGVGPIIKYEDDLSIFRVPIDKPSELYPEPRYIHAYNRTEALSRIRDLQFTWHPEKGQDSGPSFKYIGFLWDIEARSVSLPADKRLKFLDRARNSVANFKSYKCQVKDVMKIHGSLCHIAYVYPEGRNRLASLSNFTASFNDNSYAKRFPPSSVISDLRWWIDELSKEGHSRILNFLPYQKQNLRTHPLLIPLGLSYQLL
jgi:hypothetical protein